MPMEASVVCDRISTSGREFCKGGVGVQRDNLSGLISLQVKSKGLRNPPKVLILANRIKTVRFLHQSVAEAEFRAVMLHGERSQPEREVHFTLSNKLL